ncbi:MAG TPA: hypothetical protein GXX36_10745 [Clostridiaceae bacterium]|nr:hypothetical protein [Clostridiaceae bacterium]
MLSSNSNCGNPIHDPVSSYETYRQNNQLPFQQPQIQQPQLEMPTGMPTGPSPIPLSSVVQSQAPQMQAPSAQPTPQTLTSTMYIPGFLRTQIGRLVRVEFLIGSNGPLVDRTGILLGVGVSYILLRPVNSDDIMLCDLFSIKFVEIIL